MVNATSFALTKHPDVLEYLTTRGLSEHQIRSWQIGFWDPAVTTVLLNQGFDSTMLSKAGFFNSQINRITIPLYDIGGYVRGVVGRKLPGAYHPVNYLYPSKDSPYFDQHSHVLGLNFYLDDPNYFDQALAPILVEGPLDAILLQQHRYPGVCTHGTSFTVEQALTLRGITNNLVIMPDGDDTGTNLLRSIDKHRASLPEHLFFAILPRGYDPASALVEDPGILKEALASLQPL